MSKSAYPIKTEEEKFEKVVIVAWVDNEAGVLARVLSLIHI